MARLRKLENKELCYKWVIIDKIKRLGIPFITFTLIAMILKTLFSSDMSRPSQINIEEFMNAIIYPTNGPLMELWFICVLFWMFSLSHIWCWVLRRYYRICVMSIVLMLFFFIPNHIELLCINKVAYHAIWFFIGVVINKFGFEHIIRLRTRYFVIIGIICWIVGLITDFGLIKILGGITTSIGLSMIWDIKCPKLFFSFRNYTYQIFLMGIFAQVFIKMLYKRIDVSESIAYVICIIAGLYVPVIITKLIKRIKFKPLLMMIGLYQH